MSHQRERKRGREKLRREGFKEALERLHDSLLQHDEMFRQESERRAYLPASSVVRTARTTPGSQDLVFTRVEIVKQAIFTLKEAVAVNEALNVTLSELIAPSGDESQSTTTQHPSQEGLEEAGIPQHESRAQLLDQAYPPPTHEPSTVKMDQMLGIPTATPLNRNGEGDALPREDAASSRFVLRTHNHRMLYRAAMVQQQESNRTALHNMYSRRQQHAQHNGEFLDTTALAKQAVARYQLSTSIWPDNILRCSPPSQDLMERSLVAPSLSSPTQTTTKNQRKKARSKGT